MIGRTAIADGQFHSFGGARSAAGSMVASINRPAFGGFGTRSTFFGPWRGGYGWRGGWGGWGWGGWGCCGWGFGWGGGWGWGWGFGLGWDPFWYGPPYLYAPNWYDFPDDNYMY